MTFKDIINKNKKKIIFILTAIIGIVLLPFFLMGLLLLFFVFNNLFSTSYEQIGKTNYVIVDLREDFICSYLEYRTGVETYENVFDQSYEVEDVYWNDNFILVKCFPDYDKFTRYYKISLDTNEKNYTLISPATFYNTLDWQKSNGYKIKHRHF